jgi:hypothetical protein
MFPCIQTEHIGSLIRNTIGYNANSSVPTSFNRSQQLLYSQIDSLVLVDQTRLSAAFHIASHLCKPENLQYIGYKQELLFQDFLIALAMYVFDLLSCFVGSFPLSFFQLFARDKGRNDDIFVSTFC